MILKNLKHKEVSEKGKNKFLPHIDGLQEEIIMILIVLFMNLHFKKYKNKKRKQEREFLYNINQEIL